MITSGMLWSGDAMQDSKQAMSRERHLKVTPVEARQARFKAAVRGFDRQEVTAFLVEIADDYENALRQCDYLQTENFELQGLVEQYREYEDTLKSTLVSAQRVADDMRQTAAEDAATITREATDRADRMIQEAHSRIQELQREIIGLTMKRREAEAQVEATISALRSGLDRVREADWRQATTGPRRLLTERTAVPA